MPESPSKLPDDLPSPSTANPQENERVPHIQDFLATRHGWFPVSGLHLPGSVRSNGPNTWSRIQIAFLWDWAENVAESLQWTRPGPFAARRGSLRGRESSSTATGPYFKALVHS